MADPTPTKHPKLRSQNFRIILATIQRVTGVAPQPQHVLEILAEELAQRRTPRYQCPEIAFRSREIQALLTEYHHQALIDRVAAWGLRVLGPDSRYQDCYPQYVAEAEALGFRPYSLKTFKNRAYRDPLALKEEALNAVNRHRRKHAA